MPIRIGIHSEVMTNIEAFMEFQNFWLTKILASGFSNLSHVYYQFSYLEQEHTLN